MTQPFVKVTISTSGALQAALPGAQGTDRIIELKPGTEAASLTRILVAQLALHYAIGEDGAPTEVQVRHWERHQVFADSRCPFCLAEGRVTASGRQRGNAPVVLADYGGVTVRRVQGKGKGGSRRVDKSMEELGL